MRCDVLSRRDGYRAMFTAVAVGAFVLASHTCALAAPQVYHIPSLKPGGAGFSEALGVSADGSTVVGDASSPNTSSGEAYRWTIAGGIQGLGDLPGSSFNSFATSCSADGSVITGIGEPAPGNVSAFRWTQATGMTSLAAPPTFNNGGIGYGVSADGTTIVGSVGNAAARVQPCRWTPQGPQPLGTFGASISYGEARAFSADGNVVAGTDGARGSSTAFVWTPDAGMQPLPDIPRGQGSTEAFGISADGRTIVGTSLLRDSSFRAVRWHDGVVESIGGGLARDVTADGSIIVANIAGGGANIWDEVHGARELSGMLFSEFGLQANFRTVGGISDDGLVIAGTDFAGKGLVVVLPEPAIAIGPIALIILAASRQRRSRFCGRSSLLNARHSTPRTSRTRALIMSKAYLPLVLGLWTLVVTHATASGAPLYQLLNLQTFGGNFSIANAINESGQVVGQSNHADGRIEAFRTRTRTGPDTPLDAARDGLNHMGGSPPNSYGNAIDDGGNVVGVDGAGWTSGGFHAGFTLPRAKYGTTSNMGTFGGPNSYGNAINNRGQLVGTAYVTGTVRHAFRTSSRRALNAATDDLGTFGGSWSDGQGTNELGQVVGGSSYLGNSVIHAFRTAPDAAINPLTDDLGGLGGTYSIGNAINDAGQVVGNGMLPNGREHGFRTAPGAVINPLTDDLGTFGGNNSGAYAINSDGVVVGMAETLTAQHAFVGVPGKGIVDLNTLIVNPIPGAVLDYAYGINNLGQIVGTMQVGGEMRGFVLTPVPEPTLLAPLAVAGLLLRIRRRRSRR